MITRRGTWGAWWECLCRGFISSKHLQDFRFGIVRPIPEFHRKRGIKSRRKTPKSISFLASRITGSIEILTARCSLSERRRVYKKCWRWRSASERATGGSNGLELSATSRDFIIRVSVWTCIYIGMGIFFDYTFGKPLNIIYGAVHRAGATGGREGASPPHSDYPAPSLKMSVKIDFIYEI